MRSRQHRTSVAVLHAAFPDLVLTPLRSNPPSGVVAFVDEVIRAEGMDPTYLDSDLKRRMREIVVAGASRVI
jgi:hypothetical protein